MPCCAVLCRLLAVQLPAAVSSMSLNKQGSHLLLNCVDKVVRLADVRPPPPGTKPVSKEAAEDALRAAAVSTRTHTPVTPCYIS